MTFLNQSQAAALFRRCRLASLPRTHNISLRALANVADVGSSMTDPIAAARRTSLTSYETGFHGGVHGTAAPSSYGWRNKPLFRRQGDVRFKTGLEAANLLIREARRRDGNETEYMSSVEGTMTALAAVFDRNPRYAFVAKALIEPERFLQFRVSWMDDNGTIRINRGYRVQYSSALGPYEGELHFGPHVSASKIKALGFDAIFSNAVTGFGIGAAVGGSDINVFDKSEGEMQRFCQSYMTELSKYIGPDIDRPTMGMGVGEREVGYLYGQYKRMNVRAWSSGVPFLWGCQSESFFQAPGYGAVHFANEMLKDRNDSLDGKRCLILGSGKVARSVAKKLLEYGAIPLTFSDPSGYVYEPDGIDEGKLSTISSILSERGANVGRYVIASTTAQFNEPDSIFDIPCDLCFPCAAMYDVDEDAANKLIDNGCLGIIDGGRSVVTLDARKVLRKRGVMYAPHIASLTGSSIINGLGINVAGKETDELLATEIARVYKEIKSTAREFNTRGDLHAGATIAGFIRVANQMTSHGAV